MKITKLEVYKPFDPRCAWKIGMNVEVDEKEAKIITSSFIVGDRTVRLEEKELPVEKGNNGSNEE